MFLEYYGLTEQPFGVTPDPRFLYLGPKHREALASLSYGTESNRGFIALIAKPGMGKTSLLFNYLAGLREGDKARTAFVFQTDCHRRELLRHILSDLGLNVTGKDLPAMREMLNGLLLEEQRAGRRFVLVIDEAQNLEEKALESLRLLSNFETPWMKLMQIVIAGQPQLAERLAKPSLAQLRQRISMIVRIDPFTREETDEYIQHRLTVGGYKGPSLFTAGARSMISERSEGIPRNINNICFNAMSLAFALKQKPIDQKIVTEILADLDLGSLNEGREVASKFEDEPKKKPIYRVDARRKVNQILLTHTWLPKLVMAGMLLFAWSWPVKGPSIKEQGYIPVGSHLGIPVLAPRSEQVVPADLGASGANRTLAKPEETIAAQESIALINQEKPRSDIAVETHQRARSVTIRPGQTFYHVVVSELGSYNDDILRKLRELNPWLVDPSQLKAGQVIVMPSVGIPSVFSHNNRVVNSEGFSPEKQ